jgi:hypothetical protein
VWLLYPIRSKTVSKVTRRLGCEYRCGRVTANSREGHSDAEQVSEVLNARTPHLVGRCGAQSALPKLSLCLLHRQQPLLNRSCIESSSQDSFLIPVAKQFRIVAWRRAAAVFHLALGSERPLLGGLARFCTPCRENRTSEGEGFSGLACEVI